MSDPRVGHGEADEDAVDWSEEPSDLGASATIPAGRAARRDGGGGGSTRRRLPRLGAGRGGLMLVAAVVLLALVPVVMSTLKKTPRDRIAISYGGGPFEGSHFQRIIQPGSGLFFNGLFDRLYLYPSDQQNYIVSMNPTEGAEARADSVTAPSRDRVAVQYQVAVYYRLNTDRLRAFHEQFGLKYKAYTSSGWRALIEDTFRQQIENALQEETRRYDVSDIYGSADRLLQVQQSVQATLSERLRVTMGAQFFCAPTFERGRRCDDPTFGIKKVEIPQAVAAAFERNRTSEAEIQTKTNEIAQREAEARGIAALSEALRTAGPNYPLIKAIESGSIPIWVIPSNTDLALNSGSGGAPVVPGAPPSTTAPPRPAPSTSAPAGSGTG